MQPRVICLVNDNAIFVVSCTENHTNCNMPVKAIKDLSLQPIMIGKQLAKTLSLTYVDLESDTFIILTLVGGTKFATSYTKEPS